MASNYFAHPAAIVESSSIGAGTRVRAFAQILAGAAIGRDCEICSHTCIENNALIGDRVTVKSGVQVSEGVHLEDDVFVGPNVGFASDPEKQRLTKVKKGASIDANATILAGVTIGERAMVGAGSVVTHDVPPDTIVTGNPAKIVGYVGARERSSESPEIASGPGTPGVQATAVEGVKLHRMPSVKDLRGLLTFGESETHVPFLVKRYFLVYGVPSQEIRGEHAHRKLHQFLICIHGSCHAVADDGKNRQEFRLDDPTIGLHVPPGVWCVQYKHTPDTVLLVLSSERYEAADYIRNYAEFLELRAKQAL